MHIIHISTAQDIRGGERQLTFLHQGLLSKGIQSTVFCQPKSKLLDQNIPQLQKHTWADFRNIPLFISSLVFNKTTKPDIIHCHDGRSFTLGSIIGARFRIPIVISRKVLFPIKKNPFNKWKFDNCSRVIAVSEAVAKVCKEFVSDNRLTIVNDSTEWVKPILTKEQARIRLGLEKNDFVIGTVGFFTREKNLPLVLETASLLKESHPQCKIICIGGIGRNSQEYIDTFTNVITPGFIPDALSLYNAFDMYISPSTREGFGSAVLDAVVRDIPCVSLDSGGVRDLFGHFTTNLAATETEFKNRVFQVVDNYSDAAKNAQRHGEWARTIFSTDKMVNSHITIYKEILKDTN